MQVKTGILQAAITEASKSEHRFRMAAVIFSKKSIISKGRNQSNRSLKHFLPKFWKWPYSVHAEMDAVIKARQDISGMSILVVRLDAKNSLTLAKPCQHCLTYLDYVGIKKIFYSDGGKVLKL